MKSFFISSLEYWMGHEAFAIPAIIAALLETRIVIVGNSFSSMAVCRWHSDKHIDIEVNHLYPFISIANSNREKNVIINAKKKTFEIVFYYSIIGKKTLSKVIQMLNVFTFFPNKHLQMLSELLWIGDRYTSSHTQTFDYFMIHDIVYGTFYH